MANSVTRSLLLATAKERGWLAEFIGSGAFFCKISLPDGRWELLSGTTPMRTAANGFVIAKNKQLTLAFTASLGYRTPPYLTPKDDTEAQIFLKQQQEIVVKPLDGQRTEGVTVNVTSAEQLARAIIYARSNSKTNRVLLQKHLSGCLYRLFILDGQLIAAAERRAATVVGDGVHTIAELIGSANLDPRRGKGSDTPLKTINIEQAQDLLGEEGLSSVPTSGQSVRVSSIDSVSAGGESFNVTDQVHQDWIQFATKFSKAAQLFVAGFDVICDDIASPLTPADYVPLLEVNASPGLKLHQYPTGGGEAIEIAPLLLDALFP